MNKWGCPKCGCDEVKITNSVWIIRNIYPSLKQGWRFVPRKRGKLVCENPDCGHKFDEPTEWPMEWKDE